LPGTAKSELLIICQLFYPELVSTGQTMTELAEALAEKGVDVEVWAGQPTINRDLGRLARKMDHAGIRIRRLWSTQFPKLNTPGRVVNSLTFAGSVLTHVALRRPRRPLLVLTNPPFIAPILALNRLLGGAPYAYLVFDVYPDTAVNLEVLKEGSAVARVWELTNKLSYRFASKTIFIGRCMEDIVRPRLPSRTRERSVIIPVWADDPAISATEGEGPFLDRWDLRGKFVVGYSGNMGRFHDMETPMEAARRLRDHDDIQFLFVGEGYKKQYCVDFAKQHGLTNCRFETYVPREELGHLLHTFDAGLVSLLEGQEGLSVPSKTFGLLAAGTPVLGVMSPRSEIARILTERECGRCIRPGDVDALVDSIQELKRNEKLAAKFSRNGRTAVQETYGLHAVADRYVDLLEQMGSH
jgi:colanic acid biosynthesis glycosyl transferase WcaI